MAFNGLFGDELVSKTGKVSCSEALAGKSAVFIYFSAHWCPPCRGFTPKLAEFFQKHGNAKNFAVVFASSDRDQAAFDDYFGEMPWFALPFEDRARKEQLSKKYKVQGIPSLVILGPTGDVITKDGRSKVMENFDTCDGFPWTPLTFKEALGDSFQKQDGSTVGAEAVSSKTLGLYFSGHWCPPCRGFTPELKKFYTEYKEKNADFEIIFVSSDKSETEMLDYFKNDHGDWLVLPYDKRKEKGALSEMFGVDGIPCFVIVDKDGHVVNSNARGKVSAGVSQVLASGWEPPAVGDFSEGPEAAGTDINETPSLIVLCDQCDAEVQKNARTAVEPFAKKYIEKAKVSGEPIEFIFLMGTSNIDQLKCLTEKDAGAQIREAGNKPVMLLVDIPEDGAFYVSTKEPTAASIEELLASKGVASARKQLCRG